MTRVRPKIQISPGHYRYATPEEAARMEAARPRLAPAVVSLPCVHRGEPTGRLVPCEACRGTQLKTFACSLHGSCTLTRVATGTACCTGCRDYQAEDCVHGQPVARRHLVCHLLPVAGSGVWQRTVDALRLRWGLFTGRKVISVVTGGPIQGAPGVLALDPPDVVRAYLPADVEVLEVANDPERWELVSWAALWQRVLDGADPLDAVLYCHAKGASRGAAADAPYRSWADLLVRLNLDHWPLVEAQLRRCPVAGSLKKVGYRFGAPMHESRWHYSGNWYWARAGDIRQRLQSVPMPVDRWATEAWIGIAYAPDEGGVVFQPGQDFDLFQPAQMARVLGDYHRWMTAHPPQTAISTGPLLAGQVGLSIIVPTVGRASLARTLDSITSQLEPGDEVIVEWDASRDWGMTPRTRAQKAATGRYLLFQDDDDEYLPGALAAIRAALAEHPGRPHLFRMKRGAPYHDLLPYRHEVKVGQVSTQMFVCPNDPARLGKWSARYEGDFDFISSTLVLWPAGSLVWRDEVIAHWRPGTVRFETGTPGSDALPSNSTAGLAELLRDVIAQGALRQVVEVGCHRGVSTAVLAAHAGMVHAVDPWDDDQHYRAFLLGDAGSLPNVRVVRLRSPAAAAAFPDAALDLVYIDGDHSHAAVLADLDAWLPKLRRGGWLAGHDFDAGRNPDVVRAVNERLGRPDRVYPDSSWLFCVWP